MYLYRIAYFFESWWYFSSKLYINETVEPGPVNASLKALLTKKPLAFTLGNGNYDLRLDLFVGYRPSELGCRMLLENQTYVGHLGFLAVTFLLN